MKQKKHSVLFKKATSRKSLNSKVMVNGIYFLKVCPSLTGQLHIFFNFIRKFSVSNLTDENNLFMHDFCCHIHDNKTWKTYFTFTYLISRTSVLRKCVCIWFSTVYNILSIIMTQQNILNGLQISKKNTSTVAFEFVIVVVVVTCLSCGLITLYAQRPLCMQVIEIKLVIVHVYRHTNL